MNSADFALRNISEKGVALLTAIFVLMLVSVVALAMLLSSGTESAIAGNYRLATQSFYAGYSGLQEARGRMWTKHPFALGALLPSPMTVGQAVYITNPAGAETVSPTTTTNAYYDSEYFNEFGVQASTLGAAAVTTPSKSSTNMAGFAGPLFKWVRITPTTEKSENMAVDSNACCSVTPILFDGLHQYVTGNFPTLANEPTGNKQVYTLTSLAVLPNGTKRMLQQQVAMELFNFTIPAPLTLDGNSPAFQKPSSVPFKVNGTDQSSGAGCPPPQAAEPAVGVVGGNPSINSVVSNIQTSPNRSTSYTGSCATTPCVADVSSTLASNESSPSQLEALVQQIESTADYVVTGPATSLPSYGTASDPVTIVVDSSNNGDAGNLSLSGNITGYGVLVVRGTYSPAGTVGWNGLVLVIGQGDVQGSGGGNNSYNGAVFVAQTRDASGNLLATLGTPTFDWSGGGGNGILYNSCAINNATQNQTYQVLSFHEIPQ